jgi:hypothetical protein
VQGIWSDVITIFDFKQESWCNNGFQLQGSRSCKDDLPNKF